MPKYITDNVVMPSDESVGKDSNEKDSDNDENFNEENFDVPP